MTQQGWECPRCHATYAPWVSRCGEETTALIDELCPRCRGGIGTSTSTSLNVIHLRPEDVYYGFIPIIKVTPVLPAINLSFDFFEELYRCGQTHTRKVTIAPPPVTLTNNKVSQGFAGEA